MSNTTIEPDSPFYGHVDHVVVMGCTRYRRRQTQINNELTRVGVSSYNLIVQPDSPIPGCIIRSVRHFGDVGSVNIANIWFNHYRAIRTCYDMGYDRVLLIEDDATFISDLSTLSAALDEIVVPYSILLLDPMIMSSAKHAVAVKRGVDSGLRGWALVDTDTDVGTCPRCAGCRILSKEAIEDYVWLHECIFTGKCPDGVIHPADMWHSHVVQTTGLPLFYAVPPLSIQGLSAEKGKCTGHAHAMYMSQGVDVSKYGACKQ